ncbi:hypothetical protein ACJBU5_11360, partial [Streptococcus suis]
NSYCRSSIVTDKFQFEKKYFSMYNVLCHTNDVQILSSELSDRFLTELLSLEQNMVLSLHIQA